MSETFENKLLDEENYLKYLDDLKKFYELKSKYYKKIEAFKKTKIKDDLPIDSKKKIYSKYKPLCINCNKIGGTIFKETDKMVSAICGNTESPCDLKLEIVKMNNIMVNNELIL